MRQSKIFTTLFAPILFVVMCAMPFAACIAGVAHINQVEIKKESPTLLRFEFKLNPSQLLHQLMAPTMPFPVFLKTYAEYPEAEFQKALVKALKKLELENYVLVPSGVKLPLKQWQVPSAAQLQNLLKQNLIIVDLPASFQSHMEPIAISATALGKMPLSRAQLGLSAVFFPVYARYQQDAVWFTQQLPVSLFDF
jgi:hypothetical protein